jgi:hypothetical protein
MKLHTIKDAKRIYIITIKYKIIKNAFTFFILRMIICMFT